MSINNNFFQDEIFDTESFENSYYFPPVFSSSDDIDSNDMLDLNDSFDSTDVLDQFRSESLHNSSLEPGFDRLDASGSLVGMGVNPLTSQAQPTLSNPGYIQAYLRTQIGKFVRIEFLIGTNLLTDRSGILTDVGINYITLTDASGAQIMADLYAIKFVTTARPDGTMPPR